MKTSGFSAHILPNLHTLTTHQRGKEHFILVLPLVAVAWLPEALECLDLRPKESEPMKQPEWMLATEPHSRRT